MTLFKNVAVIGFGTMGAGIAQVIAQSDRSVTVLEEDVERIESGRARLEEFLDEGIKRGKVTSEEKDAVLKRITCVTCVEELSEAELVIEAVTEDLATKSAVLALVAENIQPDAVIATNTSAISISELANNVGNPERFAGLHFFNPAQLMEIVEVVPGLGTSEVTVEQLECFVEDIGKIAIPVKDRPGFLINKLFMPYINDVIQAYDEELASAEDIDTAIKLGLGYKMGPLELVDMIGLDVHQHATQQAYEATLDPIYAPPPLLNAMVAAGMQGNKNNKGFRTEE